MPQSVEEMLDQAEDMVEEAQNAFACGDREQCPRDIDMAVTWLRGIGPNVDGAATITERERYNSLFAAITELHRKIKAEELAHDLSPH